MHLCQSHYLHPLYDFGIHLLKNMPEISAMIVCLNHHNPDEAAEIEFRQPKSCYMPCAAH